MKRSQEFWDKGSTNYDIMIQQFEQTYTDMIKIAKSHLNMEAIVLDYGCGTGTITVELAQACKELHALDISAGMLTQAKMKTREQGINNIFFTQSDLFEIDFDKKFFDVIFAFNVFHFISDSGKYLRKMHELLKEGGLLISSTPCLCDRPFRSNLPIYFKMLRGKIPYIKSYSYSKLKKVISDEKFEILSTKKLVTDPPNHLIVAKKV